MKNLYVLMQDVRPVGPSRFEVKVLRDSFGDDFPVNRVMPSDRIFFIEPAPSSDGVDDIKGVVAVRRVEGGVIAIHPPVGMLWLT